MITMVFQEELDPIIDNMQLGAEPFLEQKRNPVGDSRFPPGKPAEAKLIESAMAGNLSTFNQLIEIYQDKLYWWVFSLVKEEDLTEDITQSTFISAFQKLASFRGGSFQAWLFKIARNRSYDALRWKTRYPIVSLDGSPEEALDRLPALSDKALLPEDALIATEQSSHIEKLLNQLPAMSQQVLRLIDMEGMDYQEASDILNLPLGTVKSRLARARWKLRELLKK